LSNDAYSGWFSATVGSSTTIQNSQCALDMGHSSVVSNGNTLTMTLAVTFTTAFSGGKHVYLYAASGGGANSGDWQSRGTWTVAPAVVTVDSVSPTAGTGIGATFTAKYSDVNGAADLSMATIWFASTSTSSYLNSCMIYYSRSANTFNVANDGYGGWF